jgi:hypothetical protein
MLDCPIKSDNDGCISCNRVDVAFEGELHYLAGSVKKYHEVFDYDGDHSYLSPESMNWDERTTKDTVNISLSPHGASIGYSIATCASLATKEK